MTIVQHNKSTKPWNPRDCCQWVFKRKEGDIEVFARTAQEALIEIRANGFHCPGVKAIERVEDGWLTDYLKQEEIQ